jgi:hypothetical protein
MELNVEPAGYRDGMATTPTARRRTRGEIETSA